jgi:hypothetical protein
MIHPPRRDFMKELLAAGLFPGLAPFAQQAGRLLQQPGVAAQLLEPDPDAFTFWNDFLGSRAAPAAQAGPALARGRADGLEREAFFFHYGPHGIQPAMDLPSTDLLPSGDVSLSVNVVAFRPGNEDRALFERVENAQLRLDFVQETPILDFIDTMAWTALAALHADRTKKLPPLQNLAFDPGASWQKMQNIVLPGGHGLCAVNLYAQQKASFLCQLIGVITKEVDRFAPVLGLPGISTAALQSFNAFYGALHSSPEYLFKSNPVPVFATASAMTGTVASRGLPLRSGTYMLVPVAHAQTLSSDRLSPFDLSQGLLVPKNTPTNQVQMAALTTLPEITYATIDVNVKPCQATSASRSGQAGTPGSAPAAPDDGASTTPAPAGRGRTGGASGAGGSTTAPAQGGRGGRPGGTGR